MAAKSWSITDVKGLDYPASISHDSSNTTEENMEDSKAIPGLLFYKFKGKSIPGLMFIYPKGSIISETLTEALK